MQRYLIVAAISLSLIPFASVGQDAKANKTGDNAKPAQIAPTTTAPKPPDGRPLEGKGSDYKFWDDPVKVAVTEWPTKDGYDKAAFWVNVSLAGVGLIGVIVGVCTVLFVKGQVVEMRRQRIAMQRTLIAIRRQANVMEIQAGHMERQTEILKASLDTSQTSANAALAQIIAMKSRERAKLVILTPKNIEFRYVHSRASKWTEMSSVIQVANHGYTEAFEVTALGTVSIGSGAYIPNEVEWMPLKIPPVIPKIGTDENVIDVPLYAAEDGPVISLSAEEENDIETGNQRVRFVGWVRYTDIFGDPHETPFNFLWEPARSEYIGEDEGWYQIPPEWKNESAKAT